MEIHVLKDRNIATKIGDFLTGDNAFQQTWAPNEKEFVKKAVLESIDNENHIYWYVEEEGKIIAALGIRENKYGSGGFEMDEDYVAVHKDFRKRGIANQLMDMAENYIKEKGGRYLHALTCDIDSYAAARAFYENRGFEKVAVIPDYYVEGEGRIDYFKKF